MPGSKARWANGDLSGRGLTSDTPPVGEGRGGIHPCLAMALRAPHQAIAPSPMRIQLSCDPMANLDLQAFGWRVPAFRFQKPYDGGPKVQQGPRNDDDGAGGGNDEGDPLTSREKGQGPTQRARSTRTAESRGSRTAGYSSGWPAIQRTRGGILAACGSRRDARPTFRTHSRRKPAMPSPHKTIGPVCRTSSRNPRCCQSNK